MRIMSIASGSSGNCIYVGSDNAHILIDAGVSRKRICEGLKETGISVKDLDAVFLTHEHSDHVKAAGIIMRNDEIPFYSTAGTLNRVVMDRKTGYIDTDLLNVIKKDHDIVIGDITIKAFGISHDAADPVAYTVSCGDSKAGVITDLGTYDGSVLNAMKDCNAFLAEANHDVRMLQSGSYPYDLKRRILSCKGHLSNEDSGVLISRLLNDDVKAVLLGHLSRENNYDLLALETVKQEINLSDTKYTGSDFKIEVAGPDKPSSIIEI